jgi:carbon storage regulator CsrA
MSFIGRAAACRLAPRRRRGCSFTEGRRAMLCLSRQLDESIVLLREGRVIAEVKVYEIRGDVCRIAIDAPAETVVLRQEVYEREQRAA